MIDSGQSIQQTLLCFDVSHAKQPAFKFSRDLTMFEFAKSLEHIFSWNEEEINLFAVSELIF